MIQQGSIINISDSLSNISSHDSDSTLLDSLVNIPKETIKLVLNPINTLENNWVFYWISVVGILVILSKILFPKHFNNTIQALINTRAYNNLINEGVNWKHPINLILTIAYILSVSIVIYIGLIHSLNYNSLIYSWDIIFAFKITLSIVVLIFVKMLIVLFTQVIFQIRDLLGNYLNYLFLSYSFLGIILFFFLWILVYTDYQIGIYISTITITMVYLFRIYKLLSLWNSKNNFNLFHFIIYLCTVEILPLVIFRKLYYICFLGN